MIEEREVRRGPGTDSVMVKEGREEVKVAGGENRVLEWGEGRDRRKHEGD